MKDFSIYQVLARGSNHDDFCEDNFCLHEFNEKYFLCAVFDGCSGGIESYFASSLFRKSMNSFNANRRFKYQDSFEILYEWIWYLVQKIKASKNLLDLNEGELLSTCITMVYDTENNEGYILAIGDGVVVIDGEINSIDQDNMPDYLTYHLDKLNSIDDVERWVDNHKQLYKILNIKDVSICTDGVESYKFDSSKLLARTLDTQAPDPIRYMTIDAERKDKLTMLQRKNNILRTQYGLVHRDDLAIIRFIHK